MVRGLDFCSGEARPSEWKKKKNVPETSVTSLSRLLLWLAPFSDSHKVCYEEKRKTSRTVLLYLLLLQRDSVGCLVPDPDGMFEFLPVSGLKDHCINHNLSKGVWQAGCNAALIAKDKSCHLSGYLSSQACR